MAKAFYMAIPDMSVADAKAMFVADGDMTQQEVDAQTPKFWTAFLENRTSIPPPAELRKRVEDVVCELEGWTSDTHGALWTDSSEKVHQLQLKRIDKGLYSGNFLVSNFLLPLIDLQPYSWAKYGIK
jgi:hypothetical protein